jgi:hypothetical protein
VVSLTFAYDTYPGVSPAVSLVVSSSPAVTAPLTIERVHPDGSRHELILPAEPKMVGGGWVGVDRHIIPNEFFTYEASSGGQTGSVEVSPVYSEGTWLIHPIDDALAVLVDKVAAVAPRKFATRAIEFRVHGSATPVHRTAGPRMAETGQLTIKCETSASLDSAFAVFADDLPLLLTTPHSGFETRWLWIQPGDIEVTNPAGKDWFSYRYVTVPFTATAQPDVAALAAWTYAKLDADFATYTAVDTAYATYADMALDRRS